MGTIAKEKQPKTAWHPAFASAMKLEFRDNESDLIYEVEHVLNQQPLKVDFIVIKKNANVKLSNEIGEIFRGHNLVEFKSEDDVLNIDTVYKTIGYACLYKAYGRPPKSVDRNDVTVTLIRRTKPLKLLKELGEIVSQTRPGIYRIDNGMLFPLQIIVTKELEREKLHWIRTVARGLDAEEIRQTVTAVKSLEKDYEKQYADDVLTVLTKENDETIQRIKEEDSMCKELMDIMRPEIDAEIKTAKEDAMREGKLEGMREGMREGRKEGMREGRKEGMREGRKEGVLAALASLVKDGLLNIKEAAKRAGMSEKDFRVAMASF